MVSSNVKFQKSTGCSCILRETWCVWLLKALYGKVTLSVFPNKNWHLKRFQTFLSFHESWFRGYTHFTNTQALVANILRYEMKKVGNLHLNLFSLLRYLLCLLENWNMEICLSILIISSIIWLLSFLCILLCWLWWTFWQVQRYS